jgi:hypothetical protein
MAYLSADAVIAFRGQMLSGWAFSNQIFGKSPVTASGVMFLFGHLGFLSLFISAKQGGRHLDTEQER